MVDEYLEIARETEAQLVTLRDGRAGLEAENARLRGLVDKHSEIAREAAAAGRAGEREVSGRWRVWG